MIVKFERSCVLNFHKKEIGYVMFSSFRVYFKVFSIQPKNYEHEQNLALNESRKEIA